jgi:hypothetical protein
VCAGPGAATKLYFAQAPTSSTAGASIPVIVHVRDAQDNLVTSSSAPVSLSIDQGGTLLSGAGPTNAIGGVATISLQVKQAQSGYHVTAASGVLTTAVSAAFDISFVWCLRALVSSAA